MTRNAANRLAITSAIAAVLLLCAYASGSGRRCTSHSADVQNVTLTESAGTICAADNVSETEVTAEESAPLEENENKVRQAARDLIKEKYSSAKVEGVFTLSFRTENLYLAGADVTFGDGSRRTVDMLVRQYTKRTGGTYWRAESLGPDQVAAYMKQLSEESEAAPTHTDEADADDSQ